MKIEPHLTIVKKPDAPDILGQPNHRAPAPASPDRVVNLICRENQRAWRLDGANLQEARQVLVEVQNRLGSPRGEALAEVHRLDSRCLVRLR